MTCSKVHVHNPLQSSVLPNKTSCTPAAGTAAGATARCQLSRTSKPAAQSWGSDGSWQGAVVSSRVPHIYSTHLKPHFNSVLLVPGRAPSASRVTLLFWFCTSIQTPGAIPPSGLRQTRSSRSS